MAIAGSKGIIRLHVIERDVLVKVLPNSLRIIDLDEIAAMAFCHRTLWSGEVVHESEKYSGEEFETRQMFTDSVTIS
jgi:hypothetical protein